MKLFLVLGLVVTSLQAQVSVEAPFMRAVVKGDLKTAENLLSAGLNPDLRDRFGRTLLINTATFGDTGIASLLLSYHADPNAPTNRKPNAGEFPVTPLQCAARTGNLQMAGLLIDAGAEVNATGGTEAGRTPLLFAVLFNHLDVIRLLIEKGAEVNVRDREGASPLDYAAWQGSLDVVAMLLAHGARLNESATQTGATPINEAAYRGHTALIQYLLQFHPNLEISDKKGYGPLENAIRMGKEDSALLLLGPEAKLSDAAVEMAIKRDQSRLMRELLRHKAGGTTLESGFTPLDLAASNGSVNVARVLLEGGANANAASRNGSTPLEDASLKGFEAIVTLLLDHGAQVNQVNRGSGTTALYAAAAFGKDAIVKLLLERGADPSLCGRNGKTALQAASENGFSGAAGLLRERGGHVGCKQ